MSKKLVCAFQQHIGVFVLNDSKIIWFWSGTETLKRVNKFINVYLIWKYFI